MEATWKKSIPILNKKSDFNCMKNNIIFYTHLRSKLKIIKKIIWEQLY